MLKSLLASCLAAAACRDFQENSAEQESERQARLSRFSGAAAISSDAYFNRWGLVLGQCSGWNQAWYSAVVVHSSCVAVVLMMGCRKGVRDGH
jgi:hypothetical protein